MSSFRQIRQIERGKEQKEIDGTKGKDILYWKIPINTHLETMMATKKHYMTSNTI